MASQKEVTLSYLSCSAVSAFQAAQHSPVRAHRQGKGREGKDTEKSRTKRREEKARQGKARQGKARQDKVGSGHMSGQKHVAGSEVERTEIDNPKRLPQPRSSRNKTNKMLRDRNAQGMK